MQYRALLPLLLLSGGVLIIEGAKPRLAANVVCLYAAIGGWMIVTFGYVGCSLSTPSGEDSKPI